MTSDSQQLPTSVPVTVAMTSEVEREATFDVDLAEFAEWSGQQDSFSSGRVEMTAAKVKEFIWSHRDCEEIKDALWSMGHEVSNSVEPFVEIDRVRL